MKVKELLSKIEELSYDKKEFAELLIELGDSPSNKDIMPIDKTVVLLCLGCPVTKEEDIAVLADSSYAKYLAPELFNEDSEEIDENDQLNKVKAHLKENLADPHLDDEVLNVLKEHELLRDINPETLVINKAVAKKISDSLKIQINCDDSYSFAMSQAPTKFINEIIITNTGEEDIEGLRLVIKTNPNYIEFKDIDIAVLNPNQPVSIQNFEEKVNLDDLLKLEEKIVGNVEVSLYINNIVIKSFIQPVNYLSFNTWLGQAYPNSVALFVTPNDLAVTNIVSLTAKTLQRETGSASLDDYQSGDPENVIHQVKALYDTIYNQGIAYITVKASFETEFGQKIRIPHEVIKRKQGTCFDLSIMFASCLEAMGLEPFIVLVKGHAFFGVSLSRELFETSIITDASRLVNLINDNEVIVLNSTNCTTGSTDNFDIAMDAGKELTNKAIGDEMFEVIDIRNARLLGYLPLPVKFDDMDALEVDYYIEKQNQVRLHKTDYNAKKEKAELSAKGIGKFDLWEKKLLDLSKRNPLVSYSFNTKGLQLFFYDLNKLYAAFKIKGKSFTLNEAPIKCEDNKVFELPTLSEENYNGLMTNFNKGFLSIYHRGTAPLRMLKSFYRDRRSAFEESGSNIFYLAIGFLCWFESEKSTVPKYSPLILVPLDLKQLSKDTYAVAGREEPPFLNISIFEFLHQEYQLNFDDILSSDLLNNDEEETNIDAILNTISEKVKSLSRTSMVKTAALSTFNFSKAVMWQDIKFRKDELVKNKVVNSIIEGGFKLEEKDKLSVNYNDDDHSPMDLAIPLDADSSQIAAIKDCADGKNFILQGPPGTGKSQTITNMIVNSIYHEKTVLFVAEKMAALEVVQNRLVKLGLERFALEAHSIKADKASIMDQFAKRIELGAVAEGKESFEKKAAEIEEHRERLNKVMNILHKNNDLFISFYNAFVNYLDIDEDISFIDELDDEVLKLDAETFNSNVALLAKFETLVKENGGYANNPFVLYRNPSYVPGISRNKLDNELKKYANSVFASISAFHDFTDENDIKAEATITAVSGMYQLLMNEKMVMNTNPVLFKTNLIENDTEVRKMLDGGVALQNIIAKYADYDKALFDLPAEDLYKELETLDGKSGLAKALKSGSLVKQIKKLYNGKDKIRAEDLDSIYNDIITYNKLKETLESTVSDFKVVFGNEYKEDILAIDYAKVNTLFTNTKKIYDDYGKAFSANVLKDICQKSQEYSILNAKAFTDAYKITAEEEKVLKEELFYDVADASKYHLDTYEQLLETVNESRSKMDSLASYSAMLTAYNNCIQAGLVFAENADNYKSITDSYRKTVFYKVVCKAISMDNENSFNSVDIRHTIDEYKTLISEYQFLTTHKTAEIISSRMPNISDASAASSEQGILNKAIKNKCRGKSIRQLFTETKDIITKMFPVFLMSPISCAQYLSPDMPKFDIVIFDEASQMPTSEAIGAIARGKSLVVVGDSMQMPPTSFFQSKGNEEDYVDIQDQESILDDCDVIGMPSRYLGWHYRSKHESLIRFSNAKFYNNNLTTFPSPEDMISKITYKNVNGVYGEKRATNEKEAKAIVEEIGRRLKSPELRKRSIGVVTFSQVQQELVEDLLADFFAANKDLELLNAQMAEPLIVKNLENIQGDERDVILFSICYGPDKNKTMHYRFGPINMQGGEKRLNVAISRARYEMMVFASFEPELLLNMKTESIGAKYLAAFLRYAKYGPNELAIDNSLVSKEKVGFEKSLAEELTKRGYKVKTDVGKSNFRVDLAIVDPNNDDRYILGVICDSYSYENAISSRDRNIVQPNVLKALGWQVMRVWSFDYFDSKEMVVASIEKKIADVQSGKKEKEGGKPVKFVNPSSTFTKKEIETASFAKEYVVYKKTNSLKETSPSYLDDCALVMKDLLLKEAPISEEYLYDHFAAALKFEKVNDKVKSLAINSLKLIGAKRNHNFAKTKQFFWLGDQSHDLDYYRVDEENLREMDNICKEEIFAAMKEVLMNNGTILVNELKRMTANLFGIRVMKDKVSSTLDDAIQCYISRNLLKLSEDNTKISLAEA